MSGIDEKRYFRKTYEIENNPGESHSTKSDYYGLNIATFTFGGKQQHGINSQHNVINKQIDKDSEFEEISKRNNFRKTYSSKRLELEKEKEKVKDLDKEKEKDKEKDKEMASLISNEQEKTKFSIKERYPREHKETSHSLGINPNNPVMNSIPISLPVILNKIGAHNSFLSVVVHSLWNLTIFRNFLLNEIHVNSEKDIKNRLLYELKNVMIKFTEANSQQATSFNYNITKKIDISRLRTTLSDVFQSRRKFLVDQPDDPVDCFFAFINAAHSYAMKNSLNEVIDSLCNNKCTAHKNFWIDLSRIEECECKGSSKRFYSHHNYIFDIPLDKIFQLSNNINLIEMSKSFKLKTGKFSHVGSTELANISDLKGKLFLYLKMLLNHLKVDCPAKGIRCEINKTTKNLYLNNLPNYLTFALQMKLIKNVPIDQSNQIYNYNISVTETLKTFILIPKLFDLSTIFDHSSKQKIFFEFFGGICIKPGKTYTCFFKNTQGALSTIEPTCTWIHYDDERYTCLTSWFELISFCLKNLEFPLMLFYQIQEKYSDNEKELSLEELQTLERYARNADNLSNILLNRFRSDEDIINYDYDMNFLNENNEYNLRHLMKRQKQNSKNSTSISTSKPNSNNNSNSRTEQPTEYICSKCNSKNRIENQICALCSKNNEDVIEDLLKKRGMNNFINIANFNVNINTNEIKDNEQQHKLNKLEKDVKTASLKKKKNYSNLNLYPNMNNVINPFVEGGKNFIKDEEFLSEDSENEQDSLNKKSNCFLNIFPKIDYNMPKQIVNKKETPILIKANTNIPISNMSNIQNKNESISGLNHSNNPTAMNKVNQNVKANITATFGSKNSIEKEKESNHVNEINKEMQVPISRSGKKIVTIDDKERYEDRILPYELMKQRSKKSLQISPNNINNNPLLVEKWTCRECNSKNKKSDIRCPDCNKLNLIPKDSADVLTTNDNIYNNSLKRSNTPQLEKMNTNKDSIKSPNKDDKKTIHGLEKQKTDKNISNNYTNNAIDKPTGIKKCICYTNYCTENIIKNKLCTICNRYVDNYNSFENSIKKKYQQELSRHSISNSNSNNNNHNTLFKRDDLQSKQIKKDDSLQNLNSKFRCPSSNPTSSKPRLNTYNRYKDIFIDHPDDDLHRGNSNYPLNPFSGGGNMKSGNRINCDPGTLNNYKHNLSSNYNSNQSTQKLHSTSKKKIK